MDTAILYSRFSSDGQIGGSSLERQLEMAVKYCKKEGLILANERITDASFSGYKNEHIEKGSLGVFLKAVEDKKIPRGTYLLFENWDRFSRREATEPLALLLMLHKMGIKIVTLADEHLYEKDSKNLVPDLMKALFHMDGAHQSSKQKSGYALARWKSKRERLWATGASSTSRMTTTCPAWLDFETKRDHKGRLLEVTFTPNPVGAATVKRIFNEAASNIGSYVIAAGLQRDIEKHPTLTGKKTYPLELADRSPNPHEKAGQSKGGMWTAPRVVEIIQSDAVRGWFQAHKRDEEGKREPVGEIIFDYYPVIIEDQRIVDQARFYIKQRADKVSKGAGRKGKEGIISNLFSGVARCAECGSTMFLANRIISRGIPGWLRCTGSFKDIEHCPNRTGVPYGKLEEAVIRDFFLIHQLAEMTTKSGDRVSKIEEELAAKKAEIGKIDKRLTELRNDLDTPYEQLQRSITAMTEREKIVSADIEALETELANTKGSIKTLDDFDMTSVVQQFRSADKNIVRKARAELAAVLRQRFSDEGISTMECYSDRTVTMMTIPVLNRTGKGVWTFRYDSDAFELMVYLEGDGISKRLGTIQQFREIAEGLKAQVAA